jgi:ribosomal protein S12 methylthiotransferase accessory factor
MRLDAKGFTSLTIGGDRDPDSTAWWSAHQLSDDVEDTTLVSCPTSIIDVGAHPPALAYLYRALERRSPLQQIPNPLGLILLATNNYLDDSVADVIRESCSRARLTLLVRLAAGRIWIGPLFDRDQSERFSVLRQRLAMNRPAELAALRSGTSVPLLPPQGIRETYEFAAASVAMVVTAIRAGSPPPGVADGIIELDPWTLESRHHPIAVIGAPEPISSSNIDDRVRVELSSSPKRHVVDGGHRVCPPDETLARLEWN